MWESHPVGRVTDIWGNGSHKILRYKGHPPSADLRYGEEDSISPSTQIFAAIKG